MTLTDHEPVYVDTLTAWPKSKTWRYGEACHLFSQDVPSLHAMAQRIGLRLAWFQDRPGFPHYDLIRTKRVLAVRAGAIEVSLRFTGLIGLNGWDAALADVGGADILEGLRG